MRAGVDNPDMIEVVTTLLGTPDRPTVNDLRDAIARAEVLCNVHRFNAGAW